MDSEKRSWTVDIDHRVNAVGSSAKEELAKNGSKSSKGKSWMVYVEQGVNTSTISADVKNWMADLECRVKDADISAEEEIWKAASIYKVPAFGRDLNPKAFTPEMVSFGPHHHDNDQLRPLVVHKERALVHFVRRTCKPLDELVNAVKSVLPKLQGSYYRLDEKWRTGKDGFLKLMITDGCFMLEVLHFAANIGKVYSPTDPLEKDYSPTDPFFSEHGIYKMPYIRRDMLLIENQLPLLLLKTLVSVQNPELPAGVESIDNYIHELVLNFLSGGDASVEKLTLRDHALDLFRHSKLWPPPSNPPPSNQDKQPIQVPKHNGVIRCARELHECGVHFKKSGTKSFRDIKFNSRKGILYLPELMVDDATECTLLNLVAYEHIHFNTDRDVTSYVCFMDEIINTANDVSLLHTKGIIQNNLGSDENVAQLFNRISKELAVDLLSPLMKVREQAQGYCNLRWSRWNWWKATLLQKYFRKPGSVVSLYAAALLTVLTIIQTLFTIYQYYK